MRKNFFNESIPNKVTVGFGTEYKYSSSMLHNLARARELYKDVPRLSMGSTRSKSKT